MMQRVGHSATFAAAVEAAVSIGGQIMPPIMATAAFIMAAFVGVPFRQVAPAATIPAVLYFVCVWAAPGTEDGHVPASRRIQHPMPVAMCLLGSARPTRTRAMIWC